MTLQIPRDDRRIRSTRPNFAVSKAIAAAALLLAIAASAAMLTVVLPNHALRDLQDQTRYYATKSLIAAGFGIDQVSLTGQRYTLDSDVFEALDLANVKTFAALDTAAALKRIERISWVDTAQLTRAFPGALNIQIQERIPAAIWSRDGGSYLIDATGRTLGPVPPVNGWVLPHIAGEGANADVPLLLMALYRHKEIEAQFSHAVRVAERRWSVVLKNGSRLELAPDREIEGLDQIAASSVLRQSVLDSPVIVDVRTPARAVMRPAAIRTSANAGPARMPVVQQP